MSEQLRHTVGFHNGGNMHNIIDDLCIYKEDNRLQDAHLCLDYFPDERYFKKHNETENVNFNNKQELKPFIRRVNVVIPMKRV